jgi:hypothetical protein
MQAGGTQRDIATQQLQEPYEKWQSEQAYNNPWLRFLGTNLDAHAFENIVQPAKQDQTGQYVAAAASAAAMAASSDERLKENVKSIDAPMALAKVTRLKPVFFSWKPEGWVGRALHPGKGATEIGFIAQEVQEIIPEVVTTRADGYLGIDYAKLTAILAGAVQELSARIDRLEGGE